jgi:hypothetical protein
MRISDLKEYLDKTVILRMTDGEVAKVRVRFADEEYDDIIVDVLESTRSQPYSSASAYTFAAAEIISADVSPECRSRVTSFQSASKAWSGT